MKIIYVCPFTGLCGGVRVVAEHVSRLASRGHRAHWWGLDQPPMWFGRQVPYRQFRSMDEIGAAIQIECDAAIVATWWKTASWVSLYLRGRSRGYYLVQDIDQETYSGDTSGSSYQLGLKPITTGDWVTEEVRQRWQSDPVKVGIAIDHDEFKPLPTPRDYNRVFASWRPRGGPNDLKGSALILPTLTALRVQNPQASLVTFGHDGKPRSASFPHAHVSSPTDRGLRELYSQAGVFLMTSRHEGFGLPALEAMSCGCPVVCTDARGNREFCRHNETALVGATPDDLARHILALQRNRDLWRRLSEAGLDMARSYRWQNVVESLERLFTRAGEDQEIRIAAADGHPGVAIGSFAPGRPWVISGQFTI